MITNILCHMIYHCHCQTPLVVTINVARQFNPGFLPVGFFPKACHSFGRPQTWTLNIYVCERTSFIWWFIMNTLCHMIFHCQTCLLSSMARQFNHGFLPVAFFPKACRSFGRPQTWTLNIHVCVGVSFIWWFIMNTLCHIISHCQTTCLASIMARQFNPGFFNDKLALPHGFPLSTAKHV